ncbi:hypothetical protein EV361DRAFT_83117 [Lentinula raphanica]|nr:hypothetical protein EV361DRAFT_83117 [Lentinula raphanica]
MSTFDSKSLPPNIYLNYKLKKDHSPLNKKISSVNVVGIPTADGKNFHFHIALLAEDQTSVHYDATPGYTDPAHLMRTNLLIGYETDTLASSTDIFCMPMMTSSSHTTAADICKQIIDSKVYQHDFDEQGNGCRHWCATVLEKLAESGIVQSDVSALYQDWELEQYRKFGDRIPMPRICGMFYK